MSDPDDSSNEPLTIGVFGGSFNPIHLGHALLAITTHQTKPVDRVVLVPVFKHAVKRDLLPFDDRVAMCQLAVAPFSGEKGGIQVSTVERDVGESNGAMLRALKERYPKGSKLLWICGDDFFRWMERPKGLETLREVSGLIVQRRLHKATSSADRFFKEPMDEAKIRATASRLNLEIDFIYGELPHFSSTLVRRAPGAWRSFLPQSVAKYLDARPNLLEQLHANLEADVAKEEAERAAKRQKTLSAEASPNARSLAVACVMRGLEAVHTLQLERGRTGLWLAVSEKTQAMETKLREAQSNTDAVLREIVETHMDEDSLQGFDEVQALAAELKEISTWLSRDRRVADKRRGTLVNVGGPEGWSARFALVEKFNPRIDVLIDATIRAVTEILEFSCDKQEQATQSSVQSSRELPELLLKWCQGKEVLGRLRAFVCSGGAAAPSIVRSSLKMRERLNQKIATKERSIARVLALQADMTLSQTRLATLDALDKLLESVTTWEWSLMGSFAPSTPLPLVHKLLASKERTSQAGDVVAFDVEMFFEASSSAIDLIMSFAKALAISGCAEA